MIVLNLELDNIYGFQNFKINFTYPKKIVKSTINCEFLKDRPNFRYKKAVILMGANATGKTSLGRSLVRIFNFIETANPSFLFTMISNPKKASMISIDFVNNNHVLHRLIIQTEVSNDPQLMPRVIIKHLQSNIGVRDTYEKAVEKLQIEGPAEDVRLPEFFRSTFGRVPYHFSLAFDGNKNHDTSTIKPDLFLRVLKAVLGTLDPSLTNISLLEGVEDAYVIRRDGHEIILQKGELTNQNLLSSGTIKGIDIAILLASIISQKDGFYYCDEHFSYIQTDLEKRIFGIMLDNLDENEQLIFTTHNSDMLDLNLPKHSYAFLGKKKEDDNYKVSVMYASDVLKRNSDSIRAAAENDVFSSIPDESLLDELENINV